MGTVRSRVCNHSRRGTAECHEAPPPTRFYQAVGAVTLRRSKLRSLAG